MNEHFPSDATKPKPTFGHLIGEKAASKLRARNDTTHGLWFGLGMTGLIGWSVIIPTLLGTALGTWLDARFVGKYSWTLALLVAGLGIGCLNAWLWVMKEDNAMHKKREESDE